MSYCAKPPGGEGRGEGKRKYYSVHGRYARPKLEVEAPHKP